MADREGDGAANVVMRHLNKENYRLALDWAIKGHMIYGNEFCTGIRVRLEAAPWGKWEPTVAIQRTQLTRIHTKQMLWMLIAKRVRLDRNLALLVCFWISTM